MNLYSYPSTHGISGLAAGGAWERFMVRLKMTIEWNQRSTWRPWLSKFGETLEGRDQVNSVMHLEAVIEWVWGCTWRPWLRDFGDEFGGRDWVTQRCTWRPSSSWTQRCTWRLWSSKFGHAFGGHDRVTQRCTWRPWSSELQDPLGGHDRARLEKYLEAVNGRRSKGDTPGAETLSIG